jgi:hypothetical protein
MKETQTRMSVLQQTHKKFKGYKISNSYYLSLKRPGRIHVLDKFKMNIYNIKIKSMNCRDMKTYKILIES